MPLCFVSIGSNIDREHNVGSALQALRNRFGPLLVSSVFETEPVGFSGAPFYNLVAGFFTDASPQQVVTFLSEIERAHDRDRSGERFTARTLDLDLLLYGDLCDTDLRLPREEIGKYAFVLEPLAEIAPQLQHPQSGRRLAQMWQDFKIHH